MNALGIPPGHRFALCLFLPDPPRGPVPSCVVLASGLSRRGLAGAHAAVEQLALTHDLAWFVPEPDLLHHNALPAAEATFAVIPADEAAARVTAHLHANELDFKDWLARNIPQEEHA